MLGGGTVDLVSVASERLHVELSFLDLLDNAQSVEHLAHVLTAQVLRGIPHRTVWHARALGNQIKHIAAVLDALRTETSKHTC